MANPSPLSSDPTDINASDRKKDHIELAIKSKVLATQMDHRFMYEPLLSPHPSDHNVLNIEFLGKKLNAPIWVSSMTGGTAMANIINKNLAKACGAFGLGMGLGSCRQLLFSDVHLEDFQVRKYMGNQPLYANLGVAQIEKLVEAGQTEKIDVLLDKLDADGLIIHVNPMQEWLQPEGDRFRHRPIDSIRRILEKNKYKVIVKEVGQGMGLESLKALLQLPLEALDFGASGGTNFALLEILRSSATISQNYHKLAQIGHTAEDMVFMVNEIINDKNNQIQCHQVIISGGVTDFLDGFYLTQKIQMKSVYGQAASLLTYAQSSYELLEEHLDLQIKGLSLVKAYLKIK